MDSSFNPSHSSLKNHLKSTVFSLVALSVIGLTSQAVAQDGLAKNTSALQPAGGWSVTRVGEGQADANTYCALSVEYPNAFMTVAQNKNNELSVAIEDETLSLQKDKTYDLWLKVGGQYATTMDMKPASEQGFILKLGQDSAFLNALRRQEALRLNASEWSVNLALNDFSLGLDELKVCLEGPEVLVDKQSEDMQAVTTTANVATIADVPPPPGSDVPAAEIAARQAKKEAAQQEKILPDALERPRPDASARVERSDKIAQNLPQGGERDPGQRPSYFSNPERMQLDEGDDASGDIVWNTQRVVLSETGLDRAAPQSQDMEARPDVEQRLRMENRQLAAALESQRRKFEQAVSEPRQDNVVQELSKRVELLLAENRNLKQQISKGQNIGVQDLKVDQSVRERANQIETQARAIASLRDENERLNAIVASLKNDRLSTQIQANAAQQYEQSLSRLTSEIQNLQAENSRLKQSLNRLSENQQRVAQQQGALEQARIRFEEAERQNKRLGQKLMEERENYARALTDMRGQFETQESIASARTASPAQDEPVRLSGNNVLQSSEGRGNRRPDRAVLETRDERARIDTTVRNRVGVQREALPSPQPVEAQSLETVRDDGLVTLPIGSRQVSQNQRKAQVSRPSYSSIQSKVTDIIQAASLPVSSAIMPVSSVNQPGFNVFQWDSETTFGTAEVTRAGGLNAFDTLSKAYIERVKRRCQGEFEAVPSPDNNAMQGFEAYDIACVSGPNQNAVASVLFLYDGEHFMTFAFESTMQHFADAMRLRDRLITGQSS